MDLKDLWTQEFNEGTSQKVASICDTVEAAVEFEKQAKARPTKSDIMNGPGTIMVVTVSDSDSTSKPFIQKLDSTLSNMSGADKMKIIALNAMKDAQLIKDLGLPVPGAAIFRQGKKLGTEAGAKATQQEVGNFMQGQRKNVY